MNDKEWNTRPSKKKDLTVGVKKVLATSMHPVYTHTFHSLLARIPTRFLNLEFILFRPCLLGFGREPYPSFSFEVIDLYFFIVRSACFCVWVTVKRSPSWEGSFSWNFSVMSCIDDCKFVNISASVHTWQCFESFECNANLLTSFLHINRPCLGWKVSTIQTCYRQHFYILIIMELGIVINFYSNMRKDKSEP